MGRGRVVSLIILSACLLFAGYAALDPPAFIAQSNCSCPLPAEEFPSAFGPWAEYPTVTLFVMQLYDYQDSNFDPYLVDEYSPDSGVNSCYDEAPGIGPASQYDITMVTGGQWQVGTIGYAPGDPSYPSHNHWGYDALGYYGSTVTYYRSHAALPCGFTWYQNMELYCPVNNTVTTFVNNTLTSQLNATSTYQCHEDMKGDYTACQTEDY